MSKIDLVVVGSSAGGVETLSELVGCLHEDFSAAMLIVNHFPESASSALPEILSRVSRFPAFHAKDEEPIRRRTILVAPPGKHLLVREGKVRVVLGPKENGHRPAIDPLFRTAALMYRDRLAGVILSGVLNDGAVGMAYVRRHGGIGIVQDPEDALYRDLPQSVLGTSGADFVLGVEGIAEKLSEISKPNAEVTQDRLGKAFGAVPMDPTEMDLDQLHQVEESFGVRSMYTCPECHGTLYEIRGSVPYFRCHVGHMFTEDSLDSEMSHSLEAALWAGLRALEEQRQLLIRLVKRSESMGHNISAKRFKSRLRTCEAQVRLLRSTLHQSLEIEREAE